MWHIYWHIYLQSPCSCALRHSPNINLLQLGHFLIPSATDTEYSKTTGGDTTVVDYYSLYWVISLDAVDALYHCKISHESMCHPWCDDIASISVSADTHSSDIRIVSLSENFGGFGSHRTSWNYKHDIMGLSYTTNRETCWTEPLWTSTCTSMHVWVCLVYTTRIEKSIFFFFNYFTQINWDEIDDD